MAGLVNILKSIQNGFGNQTLSNLPSGTAERSNTTNTTSNPIVNTFAPSTSPVPSSRPRISSPFPVPRPTTTSLSRSAQTDRRIRIKAKTQAAASKVYGPAASNNILSILYSTNGVVFPYTPIMNVNFTAEWSPYQLTHTNYNTQSYTKSAVEDITLSGQFTAQNDEEAYYTFAAMHFFRTMTKMYYGRTDPLAGATPPVLSLVGYGNGMFNELPVVIKGFSQEFSDTVDMVEVNFSGGNAWIPVLTTLIVQLGVTHNLKRVRDQFNLDDFRTGKLLTNNQGFI